MWLRIARWMEVTSCEHSYEVISLMNTDGIMRKTISIHFIYDTKSNSIPTTTTITQRSTRKTIRKILDRLFFLLFLLNPYKMVLGIIMLTQHNTNTPGQPVKFHQLYYIYKHTHTNTYCLSFAPLSFLDSFFFFNLLLCRQVGMHKWIVGDIT